MKGSRLKQTLQYQFDYFAWSSLYVYGIAIAVIAVITILTVTAADGNIVNINVGIGGVGFVHLLVAGIAGIRSDLRFFIQHGISRRTTFFSNLYGSLICSVVLGLFCEFVYLVTGHLLRNINGVSAFATQNFFSGWMTHAAFFFFACQIGALISLIYYRLNKMQQIIFSVTAIAALVFGFSYIIRLVVGIAVLDSLIQGFVESAVGFTGITIWVMLLLGALAAAGNYLLMRRVQIKE